MATGPRLCTNQCDQPATFNVRVWANGREQPGFDACSHCADWLGRWIIRRPGVTSVHAEPIEKEAR